MPQQPKTAVDGQLLIKQVQSLLDQLRTFPQYAQYVEQHKLGLIDSNLAEYDSLMDAGVLH